MTLFYLKWEEFFGAWLEKHGQSILIVYEWIKLRFLLLLQVFIKLMRRYKYLEKMHEEEMNKILVYLKGFTEEERIRLAQVSWRSWAVS